jgi:hypothetical protein
LTRNRDALETMKNGTTSKTVMFLLICPGLAGAAEFRNLGFEEANTNNLTQIFEIGPVFSGMGLTVDLLPGWQLYSGDQLRSETFLNYSGLASFETVVSGELTPIPEGNYAFVFELGTSLVQTGFVPADVTELIYWGRGHDLSVSANGQALNGIGVRPGQGFSELRYDLSAFAGQEIELRLSASVLGGGLVDNIQLIPEPSTLSLAGLAALLLLGRFYWKSKARKA